MIGTKRVIPKVAPSDLPATKRTKIDSPLTNKMDIEITDDSKSQELSNISQKVIGTHNGKFHCDEVLACFLLQNYTKYYRNAKIIRSRNPKILSKADILVDVGGIFDIGNARFDHHQSSFKETFSKAYENSKLSSAGLVYKYFGKEIILNVIQESIANGYHLKFHTWSKTILPLVTDRIIHQLFNKMYRCFLEEIDCIDNGIARYDFTPVKEYLVANDIKLGPKFQQHSTIGSMVANFNPQWNAVKEFASDEYRMMQFEKAMKIVGNRFKETLLFQFYQWLPARNLVQKTVHQRMSVHCSGQILKLETFCPWISHLTDIQKRQGIEPVPVYVLFEDRKQWRVRAVPKRTIDCSADFFASIKGLPRKWRGLRNEELSDVSGIGGCVFCHSSGFIGGNESYEGALQMAIQALEVKEPEEIVEENI